MNGTDLIHAAQLHAESCSDQSDFAVEFQGDDFNQKMVNIHHFACGWDAPGGDLKVITDLDEMVKALEE